MENMYKTNEGNFVAFHYDTEKNNFASDEKGKPQFDKVLFATVVAPGQAKSQMVYEVERTFEDGKTRRKEHVYRRFAEYIEKFKQNDDGGDLNGTPIDQWPQIDMIMAAKLKAQNIYTVESLVEVSDTGLQEIGMGARALQAKAKAFLDAANGGAGYEKMAAENEKMKDRIASLEKQIKELGKEEKPKRKKAS